MKVLTIGRDETCDIIFDDHRMSRKHAVLKIHSLGKMEIVDMGKNGTCVNGTKIRSGVPYPVRRKDVVKFADVFLLNWEDVKDPLKSIKIASLIVGCLLLVICIFMFISNVMSCSRDYDGPEIEESVDGRKNGGNMKVDTASTKVVQDNNNSKAKKDGKARNSKNTIKDLFPEEHNKTQNNEKTGKEQKSSKEKDDSKTKSEEKPSKTDSSKEAKKGNYEIL